MSDERRHEPVRPKIGLALAGGGPGGAIYEFGAIRALDEALEGIRIDDVDVYVGVSAGSFVASCLANGMTSGQLCRSAFESDPKKLPLSETFFRPAMGEWFGRALTIPALVWNALGDYLANPADQNLYESLTRLTRALPLGLFDNEPIRAYLEKILSLEGRTDDFRRLRKRLFVIAADLDSAQAIRFGEPGMDHIPISQAVQASTALPGLYPPVEIDGRHYVDGVLLKTLHASVALDAGVELLLCLNPIVPVDTGESIAAGVMRRGKLMHRGLPAVLSQTFRTLVHSRLVAGIASYQPRYPGADVILIEPDSDDYRMFFTNIFKLSNRRAVCSHAYQATRRQLLRRREELEPILERHGLRLRIDVLEEERSLEPSVGVRQAPRAPVADQLDRTLGRLETLLQKTGS